MKKNIRFSGLTGMAVAVALALVTLPVQAAQIGIVGSRGELNFIESSFISAGDTVTRFNTGWSGLSAGDLTTLGTMDIIWEGDIFGSLSAGHQSFIESFVTGGGGFFGTPERSCCETHNNGLESIIRSLTGDSSILVGDLGFDLFGHEFASTPSTILTDPNDITGISIPMDGPGRVLPGAGAPDACFVLSGSSNSPPLSVCTASAWGPDVMLSGVSGRVVYYGDINSQDDLATQDGGVLFENVRSFLLAGFSGGEPPITSVPEPATLALFGVGLAGLGFASRRRKAA